MADNIVGDDWMISVDDHLIETPDVWVDRLPARYREDGPRFIRDDLGPTWMFEDVRRPIGGSVTNGAIWPPSERPPSYDALDFEHIDPACFQPTARAAAMDRDRVISSLMFPTLPGFAGSLFVRAHDKELAALCVQAYNDWILEEWCAAIPGRFIGLAMVPLWDPVAAAAEIHRVAAKGARGISFSMGPEFLGLPSIHDPDRFWDPLFAAAAEVDIPLCTHLGTGAAGITGGAEGPDFVRPDVPIGIQTVKTQLAGQDTLLDWLYADHFQRFPKLRLVLSENGIGWIPAVLQVADWMAEMSRNRVPQPGQAGNDPTLGEAERQAAAAAIERRAQTANVAQLPSEIFREHVFGCFIHDPMGLKLIHEIGIDNVMIETDFPHTASWFPYSMPKAQESIAHLTTEERIKVLRGNAEAVFNFTPAQPVETAASA
jgi:predicted TIM-barrel fold metal-dependent hydrolase